MVKFSPIITAIFLLLSIPVLASDSSSKIDKLRWIEDANPIQDAREAFNQGDKRLRAVYGYTLVIPGVSEEDYVEYKNKFGVNLIEGTSDSLLNDEHARLNNLAYDYAMQYNKTIIDIVN